MLWIRQQTLQLMLLIRLMQQLAVHIIMESIQSIMAQQKSHIMVAAIHMHKLVHLFFKHYKSLTLFTLACGCAYHDLYNFYAPAYYGERPTPNYIQPSPTFPDSE